MSAHQAPTTQPAAPSSANSTSSASVHSQDGSNPSSTPGQSQVTLVNDAGAHHADPRLQRPAPVKKPSMTSRISGMFKPKGDDSSRDASRTNLTEKLKDMTVTEDPAPQQPVTVALTENGASTTSSNPPSRQGSTRQPQVNGLSADSKVMKSGAGQEPKKLDENGMPKRFWITQDGLHEHQLKVAKRNQKLKDMVRGWFEKGKGNEDQPLTLMADWIAQKRTEEKAPSDLKGGPSQSNSLVEKYGKCQEIVGHGAFGIVRVSHKVDAKDPKRELLFAVKEFRQRPGESAKKYQKRLTSEFCLSSSMEHPNVIHTLDLLQDDKGDYCEVMEYCAGGDLYTLILAAGSLEVLEADCYFKQLMRGVEYMHEMGVAHRDLKPENLLLTQHGALKITDFGNGECFRMAWERDAHMTAGLCGSGPYIAPEEYVEKEFDPRAVDIWACGIIYMAMRTGRHLWRVAQKDEDEFFTRYLEDRKEETGFRPIEVLRRVSPMTNIVYVVR
ncbi:MAG: protein kinase [Terriglobus roseus]|nr:protein kinase [Terriglobus roseus]